MSFPLLASAQMQVLTFTTPGNADDWSTCDPGKTFSFQLVAADTSYSNVSFSFSLTNGLEYVSGSISPSAGVT
ncbi:MAG: hypothetical protein AAFP02_26320, partial [Bacteroidota bacterium]